MDSSQYIRRKQEAANVYVARNKTVDSSFLTMTKQQKSAYSGYVSAPSSDPGSCPKGHAYTNGYSSTNDLSQQEFKAMSRAGAVLCGSPDYSNSPTGMTLKNCTEVSMILNEGNTITVPSNGNTPVQTKPYGSGSMPGQWVAYGYGQNHYFPNADKNSQSTCCVANKYPYSSG